MGSISYDELRCNTIIIQDAMEVVQRIEEGGVAELMLVDDVRAVVRLLGEVMGEHLPRLERTKRLMEGATRLMNGDVWIWWYGRHTPVPEATTFQILDGGYTDESQQALVRQWSVLPETYHQFTVGIMQQLVEHTTVSRAEVIQTSGIEESRTSRMMREQAGLGDYLIAFYPMGDGRCSAAGIHRAASKGLFTERERVILHTLTAELDLLHGAARVSPAEAAVQTFSPRLKQVLMLVLEGHSRKQIARTLELSEHTVGGYLKELHTRLNVNSRAELMAHFLTAMS